MDKDLTVGKLKINVEEFNISLRTALEYAYAAGYDQRGKELSAHHKKRVLKIDINGVQVGEYGSAIEAAIKNKVRVAGIYSSIERGSRTKKGFYWKYADNGDDKHQQE